MLVENITSFAKFDKAVTDSLKQRLYDRLDEMNFFKEVEYYDKLKDKMKEFSEEGEKLFDFKD